LAELANYNGDWLLRLMTMLTIYRFCEDRRRTVYRVAQKSKPLSRIIIKSY